jgi:2,4-dienoyl-CoA reductase-like NADH-dependent reductase (Old Yellow Enzyme family)
MYITGIVRANIFKHKNGIFLLYHNRKGRGRSVSFKEFNYNSLQDVIQEVADMGLQLDFSTDTDILGRKVQLGSLCFPNALAVHPMEGSDGTPDGSPDELTIRRYERFSRGGAGLLWFEAVAVTPEAKASPRQLWIHERNVDTFAVLADNMRRWSQEENGRNFEQLHIMQLTHSGRFSKPEGKHVPIIAYHDPILDPRWHIDPELPVISDDELERLEEQYVQAAVLAHKAGFHGVDVKCCHRYLISELLSGFTREGRYGGTFEGRTKLLTNIIGKIRDRLGKDFIIASRMNIYDGIPYPYGWGVDREDTGKYDMREPLLLVKKLQDLGVQLLNLTMGTPYYNPHVNRPYDKGAYVPQEHPLEGVQRLTNGIGEIQQAFPDMAIVGTGYSWLRQFAPNLAAGTLEKGKAKIIGFGREAFAYPDYARDIIREKGMKKEKCCIACGKCAEILRAGGTSGCVIRDAGVYGPIYRGIKG